MRNLSARALILGGGLSGLAAAARLRAAGVEALVLEREAQPGGLVRSRRAEGFTFDHGPHVSFTRRPEIQALLANAVDGRFREAEAVLLNLYCGHWLPHPAQSHLYGLPPQLVADCLADLAAAPGATALVANYADWCRTRLGKTFAEEFTFRYTRKYWTVEPDILTPDWVGTRVHVPSVREVALGALSPTKANQHYITHYRYPTDGGFDPYLRAVLSDQPIATGCEVMVVDPRRRRVELSDSRSASYERLVSSLPLPALIDRLLDAPSAVREAARALRCTTLMLVNVGLRRIEGLPEADWMYFYDDDLVFARACLPHRLAVANAPAGCGSIQLEIYGSEYRPLPNGDLAARALDGLRRAGILLKGEDPAFLELVQVPFANVIFDTHRASAVALIRAWLSEQGIETCGRFGEWAYLWTDDSILSGWGAAERTLHILANSVP